MTKAVGVGAEEAFQGRKRLRTGISILGKLPATF